MAVPRTHGCDGSATAMQNWIGIGIWIVLGAVIGLIMKAIIKRPEETPGHPSVIMYLGAAGGVIGGMLGVGTIEFFHPNALSVGGMFGAVALATFITWL